MDRKLIFFAVLSVTPFAANAADVVPVPPTPVDINLVVTSPSQMTTITGPFETTLWVTYRFNNFEYTLPGGNGSTPFDLPFGGPPCTTSPGQFYPRHICRFPWQPAGFYKLTNGGSVDNIVFSVPEPATWAMMVIGIGGIGAAMRSRRRATQTVI